MDFLHRLAQQRRYPLSDLAGQCWALTVGTIPSYEYTSIPPNPHSTIWDCSEIRLDCSGPIIQVDKIQLGFRDDGLVVWRFNTDGDK